MAGHAEIIDPRFRHIKRQNAGALRCIYHKQQSTFMAQPGNLRNWQNGAKHIGSMHTNDHTGVGFDHFFKIFYRCFNIAFTNMRSGIRDHTIRCELE